MSIEFKVPPLGTLTSGTVSRWLREVGDPVEADEPLVEFSTDKAEIELPCPADGILLEIRVEKWQTARVGAVLGIIGVADDSTDEAPPEQPVWVG